MSTPQEHQETARVVTHFSGLLATHGASARSLDWGSRHSQETRFSVLAGVGDLAHRAILDVGCGLADLHAWLLAQGTPHHYVGLDITPAMVAQASLRFPDIAVHQGDALTSALFPQQSFDYVFASGLFYLRQTQPLAYLQDTVAKLFALCRRGLAFNSLSAWSPRQDPQEFYADPQAVLACCRALTPRLVLRHDYHPGDFTMYLYREPHA